MKDTNSLSSVEHHWETRMGKMFPGERVVFRGKDLFHDLDNIRWMQLYLYGITGRFFTEKQEKLFEGIWIISTSYPDPRIWNNRIASLAGTVRSTGTLGICASLSASDANIYGHGPAMKAMNFLVRARKKIKTENDLQEIIKHELSKYKIIYGYGRPILNRDERITPLYELAKRLGLANGPYLDLAFNVEKYLKAGRWRMRMNVAALAAALAADQGLLEREFYLFLTPSFIGGIIPCHIEAAEKKEGTFLPLRCGLINYQGKSKRKWAT